MSRQDMLNDLNKNERKQFRRLQRGKDAVSANEAYNILKGDRNIPQTGVNDPNAVFDKTDPDDMDLDNNAGLNEIPRPRDMAGVPSDIREEMDKNQELNEMRSKMNESEGGIDPTKPDVMDVDEAMDNPFENILNATGAERTD